MDVFQNSILQVIVKKNKTHRVHRVTRSLKSLGRSVGRRNRKSIVNQVIKDSFMKKLVAARLGEFLRKELIETCSPKRNSIFRDKSLSAIERFNWSEVAASLKQTAPIMFTLLEKCVCSNHRSSHALKKEVTIAVIGGILLRTCSERANIIQRVFSILLFASHSPKQVCEIQPIFFIHHSSCQHSCSSDFKKLVFVYHTRALLD